MTNLSELKNFLKASITELVPKENCKEKGIYHLDDGHAHYYPPKNSIELEELLKNMISKLGRTAITDWGINVKNVLTYEKFVSTIKDYSTINNDCSIIDRGVVSIVKYKGEKTEIYHSQEIRTQSHLHITAEGCRDNIEEGLSSRKTIDLIHKNNGKAIVEHPTTKQDTILQYVFTNNIEDMITMDVLKMADAVEVFNSYNTLWMCFSNAKAKELVAKFNYMNGENKPAIAGSDNHFGLYDSLSKSLYLKNIGRTGIYIPKRNGNSLTGEEIIGQKFNDLKDGNYQTLENYAGPITFFMTMVPPIIARKLGINKDSIS